MRLALRATDFAEIAFLRDDLDEPCTFEVETATSPTEYTVGVGRSTAFVSAIQSEMSGSPSLLTAHPFFVCVKRNS